MTTYLVLLRGVNLGSRRTLSMPQLRLALAELGFADVQTYINSGNAILSSAKPAEEVAAEVAEAIARIFAHRVDVVVRTAAELADVLAANPFPDGNPSQVTVAFLASAPGPQAGDRLAAAAAAEEPYVLAGREVYVNYTRGIGTSKLAATFSAVVEVSATVRNLRTVTKLDELCGGRRR